MRRLVTALVAIVAVAPALAVTPAHAQVHVDIGIHLPAPPALVVVPEVRAVRVAPAAPANLFFYSGQYWAFASGAWYVGPGYNGPWIVVEPRFVPRPVLLVPVRYYHVPPGHWKQWRRDHPPRWSDEWGREWAAKREWKERGRERGPDLDRGRDDDRGEGHGRGHGRGR